MSNVYGLPKVWVDDTNDDNKWANINRPVSGSTHDQDLPVGDHPLQLYSLGTPNGKSHDSFRRAISTRNQRS